MVTPGADNPNKVSPETVAEYTLKMLNRRVPPAVPGIMFLSGGQSEMESTLNLNAMNQTPNPWHVSFSYARALQNTVLKTWQGQDANVEAAQKALIGRAKANSMAQLGKYSADGEDASASEGVRKGLHLLKKGSKNGEKSWLHPRRGDKYAYDASPRTFVPFFAELAPHTVAPSELPS